MEWGSQCPPHGFLGGSSGAMYVGVPGVCCPTFVDAWEMTTKDLNKNAEVEKGSDGS